MELFKHYTHLGFHNPYFIENVDRNLIIKPTFEEILESIPKSNRILDFTAVVELFSAGFCFGDRTLIRGLQKTPWMAKPNQEFKNWDYFSVPIHQEKTVNLQTVAETFYSLLEQELLEYIIPHENIGILLTGGMDSRIVAIALKNLRNRGLMENKNIFAFTWGNEKSRDVIYSERIAKLYDWNWEHLEVDVKQLQENLELAISNGCEFSAIHLHAMPQVARKKNIDCVLAGSFGDSVGRAEFSGRNVRFLSSLSNKIGNIGSLLRSDFKELVSSEVEADLERYHNLFPQEKEYQLFEQDQQLHYMRRMLNSCMNVINQEIPLYQMFSSPNVFGYMWSLDPIIRDNSIYLEILRRHAPELLEIPWARTGIPYESSSGEPDKYLKKHHDYGKMIRNNYLNFVEEAISDNSDVAKQLFDIRSAKNLISNLRKYPINGGLVFEDRLILVGQLLSFINKYNIKVDLPLNNTPFLQSFKENLFYKGKYIYKKVK